MNETELIDRYLDLIADPTSDLAELSELLDPEMRFLERPNLINPAGTERDLEQIVASAEAGRRMLSDQSFEVVDHLVDGDRVVTRVVWRGTLADGGTSLRADSSMHFELRDGRIVRQENYDCFHPPAAG
jgi:ketosteroid isomerase-like protein